MTRAEAAEHVIEAAKATYYDLYKWCGLPPKERGGLLVILSRLGKALDAYDASPPIPGEVK